MKSPATIESLQKHWPELLDEQAETAKQRLEEAWLEILALFPDLPERLKAGVISEDLVALVIHRVVRRAMQPQTEGTEGLTQLTQTTGPFTQALQFEGKDGAMFLRKRERQLLATGRADTSAVFSVMPRRGEAW